MQADKTCRVCLSPNGELTPLRVRPPGKHKTLEETINFVVNINIVLENGLPDKICKDCGTMLDVADTFKQRVLDAEAILSQLDQEKGTKESRLKCEEMFRENSELYSEDISSLPTVLPCSSLSDSLRGKVKNEEIVAIPKLKIKIEKVEYDDENTMEQENLDDMQGLEAPLAKVKEESSVKDKGVENYSDVPCPKDDISPATAVMSQTERQEATNISTSKTIETEGTKKTESTDYSIEIEINMNEMSKDSAQNQSNEMALKTHSKCINDTTGNTSNELLKCDVCGYTTDKIKVFNSHLRAHSASKQFSCDSCLYLTGSFDHFKRHVRTHTSDKPFSCNVCERTFSQKVSLDKHIRTHTGDKPYSCDVCGMKFRQKPNLNTHVRTHTGEKPFACNVCEKKFGHKASLHNHVRTHAGDKPYSCNLCELTFSLKDSLDKHVTTHTRDRPHSCDVCGNKFSLKSTLDKHVRTHTGEKPYACNVCEKKFSRKYNLNTHLMTHIDDKPHSCYLCGKKFKRKQHLDNHIRIHK